MMNQWGQASNKTLVPRPTGNLITDTSNINTAITLAATGGLVEFPGYLNQSYAYNGVLPLVSNQRVYFNGAILLQPNQITTTLSSALTVTNTSSPTIGGTSFVAAVNATAGFFVGMYVVIQDNSNLSSYTPGSLPTYSTTGQMVMTWNLCQISAINGITTSYYSTTGAGTITIQPTTAPASEGANASFGFQNLAIGILSGTYGESKPGVSSLTATGSTAGSTTLTIATNAFTPAITPGMSVTSSLGVGTGAGQLPANTVVTAYAGSTSVTINQNAGSAGSPTFTFGASYTFPANNSACVIASLTQLIDTWPTMRQIGLKDFEFNGNYSNNPYGGRWELSPFISSSLSIIEDFYSYNFNGDGLVISGRGTKARDILIQTPCGAGLHMSAMQYGGIADSQFANQVIAGLNEPDIDNITVNSPGMAGSAYFGHFSGLATSITSTTYGPFYNGVQCSNTENDIVISNLKVYNDYSSTACCGIGHINYSGNINITINNGEIKGMTNGAFNVLNSSATGNEPYNIHIKNFEIYECGPQNTPTQQTGGFTTLNRNQLSVIGDNSVGFYPMMDRMIIDSCNFYNSPLNIQGGLRTTIKNTHFKCTDLSKSCALIIEGNNGATSGSDVILSGVTTEEPYGKADGARPSYNSYYTTQLHFIGGATATTDLQLFPIEIHTGTFATNSKSVTNVTALGGSTYYNTIAAGMLVTGPGIPDATTVTSVSGSNGTGTVVISNFPTIAGTYSMQIGLQKLTVVRGDVQCKGGSYHIRTESDAKVDLRVISHNPYGYALLHKGYRYKSFYDIKVRIDDGFVTPSIVLIDNGQDAANTTTADGNCSLKVDIDCPCYINSQNVFGVRLSGNTVAGTEVEGRIYGYSPNGNSGTIFTALSYNGSPTSTKNILRNLWISPKFTPNSVDVGMPNVIGVPTAPVATVNTAGAGVGGTSATTGTDNTMQLTIVTSGTPGTASTICTIAYNQNYGQTPYIYLQPANAAAVGLLGTAAAPVATTTASTITLTSGTLGLTTATTYVFNILVTDISQNKK